MKFRTGALGGALLAAQSAMAAITLDLQDDGRHIPRGIAQAGALC